MNSRHFVNFGVFLLSGIVLLTSCKRDDAPVTTLPEIISPYRFDHPDQIIQLPAELNEISGIAPIDEPFIAAVQDERGILYILNWDSGQLIESHKFGKDRDYEDLAVIGDTLYVLQSDGTLHEVPHWRNEPLDAMELKTDLGQHYDTEGLAFDARSGHLLIACKEYPGENLDEMRAIYAFDLHARVRLPEPIFTLSLEKLAPYARLATPNSIFGRMRALLEGVQYEYGFKPSAISLHPITNELYIISAETKMLSVLSPDGVLKTAYLLSESLFPQPEGLAFWPDGRMLISNEAGVGPATILSFSYLPEHEAAPGL